MKKAIYSICFLLRGINCSISAGTGCQKSLKMCDEYHKEEASSEKEKFYERERRNKQSAST